MEVLLVLGRWESVKKPSGQELVLARDITREFGRRLSRFNGSDWISFDPQLSPHEVSSIPLTPKTESFVEVRGQKLASSWQGRQ